MDKGKPSHHSILTLSVPWKERAERRKQERKGGGGRDFTRESQQKVNTPLFSCELLVSFSRLLGCFAQTYVTPISTGTTRELPVRK